MAGVLLLRSEQDRRDALQSWLHQYNQHRPHTACGTSRLLTIDQRVRSVQLVTLHDQVSRRTLAP